MHFLGYWVYQNYKNDIANGGEPMESQQRTLTYLKPHWLPKTLTRLSCNR